MSRQVFFLLLLSWRLHPELSHTWSPAECLWGGKFSVFLVERRKLGFALPQGFFHKESVPQTPRDAS